MSEHGTPAQGEPTLWHVTVTYGGLPEEPVEVRAALERLSVERPFLLSGRYAADRAEMRYWEQAEDCTDACALALRVWGEHRASAGLPAWQLLSLEVVAQDVYQQRGARGAASSAVVPAGGWRPFR